MFSASSDTNHDSLLQNTTHTRLPCLSWESSSGGSNTNNHIFNMIIPLQPQNIMFTSEESSNLKLIDFGLARKLNAEKDLKVLFGTPEFVGKNIMHKLSSAILVT